MKVHLVSGLSTPWEIQGGTIRKNREWRSTDEAEDAVSLPSGNNRRDHGVRAAQPSFTLAEWQLPNIRDADVVATVKTRYRAVQFEIPKGLNRGGVISIVDYVNRLPPGVIHRESKAHAEPSLESGL